jgi:DNA-binding LytR/AlgR family response regulator
MSTLKCCVIDDEPLAGNLIGSYAERTPALSLEGVFTSAQEAYPIIASGDIDLVFLDIQMPQLSGMEFVKLLPPTTMVVFVTAFENYAIQGIRVNAVDYLLKPVNYNEFLEAVNHALRRKEAMINGVKKVPVGGLNADSAANGESGEVVANEPDSDSIIVKSEYRLRQIAKNDILYIEGLKDYVRIFVEGEPRSVMTLLSMKAIEHSLAGGDFLRVHRSFIVNLRKIHTIERSRIVVVDRNANPAVTHEIPVGDSYRPALTAYVASRSLNQD